MIDDATALEAARALDGQAVLHILGSGHYAKTVLCERLNGASTVIRVRPAPPRPFPAEIYEALVSNGAPLVPFLTLPLVIDGLEVSELVKLTVGGVSLDETARAVLEMHRAGSKVAINVGELATWNWLERVRQGLDMLEGDCRAVLGKALDRSLVTFQAFGFGSQGILHGDAHPGNMGHGIAERPTLFDLDDMAYGPLAWDWTAIVMSSRRFSDQQILHPFYYRAAIHELNTREASAILDALVVVREISLIAWGLVRFDRLSNEWSSLRQRAYSVRISPMTSWQNIANL